MNTMTRYFCDRCQKQHNSSSDVGRAHYDYRRADIIKNIEYPDRHIAMDRQKARVYERMVYHVKRLVKDPENIIHSVFINELKELFHEKSLVEELFPLLHGYNHIVVYRVDDSELRKTHGFYRAVSIVPWYGKP